MLRNWREEFLKPVPVSYRFLSVSHLRILPATQRFTGARAHAKVKASTYPNGGESRPASGDVNTNQSGRGAFTRDLADV
jgi:hypothetical protein